MPSGLPSWNVRSTADDELDFLKKALRRFRNNPCQPSAMANAGSMSKIRKQPKRDSGEQTLPGSGSESADTTVPAATATQRSRHGLRNRIQGMRCSGRHTAIVAAGQLRRQGWEVNITRATADASDNLLCCDGESLFYHRLQARVADLSQPSQDMVLTRINQL